MSDNEPGTQGSTPESTQGAEATPRPRRRRRGLLWAFLVGGALVTFVIATLLVSIVQRNTRLHLGDAFGRMKVIAIGHLQTQRVANCLGKRRFSAARHAHHNQQQG